MNSQQAALALMHILNIRFVTQGLGICHGGRRSSSLELYNVTFLWKCTVRAYQRICLHSSSWLRFTLCWRQGCCQCRRWCHLRRRHCWQVRGQRGSGWWQHGRRVTGAENILVSASWLAINEVGSTWWKGFSFLLQKFCSPPSISSFGRRTLPLHSFGGGVRISLVVSKEKAKVEPMVSEKVFWWLVSAWQKSMHWEAKEKSTEAIFLEISESRKWRNRPEIHVASLAAKRYNPHSLRCSHPS